MTVDVVQNFASFVERNPRDAIARGSTLIYPSLITKKKRLHVETEAKFKSSAKVAPQKIPEARDDPEAGSHGHLFTTTNVSCVDKPIVPMSWCADLATTNTMSWVLQNHPPLIMRGIVPSV